MADAKITQLNENTAPALGDYMPLVDDPSGTPETQYSTIQNFILNRVYPVGYVYISVDSTSPATLFGGTWAAFGAGRVLVGLDSGDTDFDTVEETGGAKTVTLTTGQIPSHTHSVVDVASAGGSGSDNYSMHNVGTEHTLEKAARTSGSAGSGQAHNNLQPYITVYMWKRTA